MQLRGTPTVMELWTLMMTAPALLSVILSIQSAVLTWMETGFSLMLTIVPILKQSGHLMLKDVRYISYQ